MLFIYIIAALFVFYSLLIIYYWTVWRAIPEFPGPSYPVSTKISVIIPARNEEENIGKLLSSLEKQSYPLKLYEIVVVDDHSEDNTKAIVKQYAKVRLLQLKADNINSYKKKALETGIGAATGDLIITTDADCVVQPGWLKSIVSFKEEKKAVVVAAPVALYSNNSVLQIFQAIDFMVLQAITGAAVSKNGSSMSNGANLAYERDAFYKVKGFEGVDYIASGDDMLLIYKIGQQYPGRLHYLKSKEAIVFTEPMKTWKSFFNQRIRWASKAKEYGDKRITAVLLLVYLFNLSFPVLAVAGFFCYYCWLWLAGFWIAKTLVELPLVYSAARFFGKQKLLLYFFFFQPLHIAYILISGFFGQIGKYEWKGRKVK